MCAGISGQLFRFAVVSKGVDKVILVFTVGQARLWIQVLISPLLREQV